MENLKVTICCGIPAAGKSTWARKQLLEVPKTVRISRDDYRMMLKNQTVCYENVELLINNIIDNTILQALSSKFNVIIDATNLKASYINHFIKLVQYKADVEFKVFDISLENAIERDDNRANQAGEKVIKSMYKDYKTLLENKFDFSPRPKKLRIFKNKEVNVDLPKAVCVDLDGTLAHHNGKRHHYDWDNCHLDDIDTVVLEHVKLYHNNGYQILIFTARDMAATNSTKLWLDTHGVPYHRLITKGLNDNRKDVVVKREMLEQHVLPYYDVFVMLDDRDGVVDMYRKMGLKTFQVEVAV